MNNILLYLILIFSFHSVGQNFNVLAVNPQHLIEVKTRFSEHPLLRDQFDNDSTLLWISIYTENCKEGLIQADSIDFSYMPNNGSKKRKVVRIIPDSLTTFSSHIFAYMLYEGARINDKPKFSKRPLFVTAETESYENLIFLDQFIDKKNQVWYFVRFKTNREMDQGIDPSHQMIEGWVLRGRTRLNWNGWGCY
ncbi:MAG: hypothetical protein EP322_02100 [Bacteroidetes bacterium]|nr:MAG: hypothetical protein EP322_02100 [Bacteroidota bacterium]